MVKVVYISGAYRSKWGIIGILLNIWKARRVARKLWGMGYAVICPHMNTALFTGLRASIWLKGDIEILKRCDAICMMRGWEKSKGSCIEYDVARDRNMIIMEE